MQTLGNYLKKEREARNISLSDVADSTKISKLYLDCLEKDDFSKIPGEPYVKGYISSYAECVGINEHEAFKLYNSLHTQTDNAAETKSDRLKDKKRPALAYLLSSKKTWLVLAFPVLLIITIGIYYSFFQNPKKAAIDKNLPQPAKIKQPTINSTSANLRQESQGSQPLQSTNPNGVAKISVNRQDGELHDDDGIANLSVPLDIHRPDQTPKRVVPYPPTHEYSSVIDSPETENYQIHLENNIRVAEAVVCSGLENRVPQAPGDSFEWSMDRIYVWSRIQCENPPSSIRHIYYFKGEKVSDISLKIRSYDWRTWSYKTLLSKRYIGPWRVEITSADGKVLQSLKFEIR